MRKIEEKTGWEAARGEVLFSVVVLDAAGEHPKQLRAMRSQVDRWSVIDVERRAAEDAIVSSHAGVAWRDRVLDRAVQGFANELLRDAGGNKDDKTFRAYFPEAPNEVIRLGLESEIERCEAFDTVRKKFPLSKSAAAKLAAVDEALDAGRVAIKARRDAFAQRMGVSLDIATWKDAANAARESVYVQLRAWGLEHGEERGYADRFFPVGGSRASRGGSDEEGEGGGGSDGGTEKPTG
jgi:hypothetical protein